MVKIKEIIERLNALGNPKAMDLIERIKAEGVAPPEGFVLVQYALFQAPKHEDVKHD